MAHSNDRSMLWKFWPLKSTKPCDIVWYKNASELADRSQDGLRAIPRRIGSFFSWMISHIYYDCHCWSIWSLLYHSKLRPFPFSFALVWLLILCWNEEEEEASLCSVDVKYYDEVFMFLVNKAVAPLIFGYCRSDSSICVLFMYFT